MGNSHVLAVISDQETRGAAGASAQSGPGHASDDVHHRDQQGPGVGPHNRGCLVSHIVNINITHNSEGRDRNMENITGVLNTVNTANCEHSRLNPPSISFFSSSHELLVTEIEHGLICATEIETYCALWMRMFTET